MLITWLEVYMVLMKKNKGGNILEYELVIKKFKLTPYNSLNINLYFKDQFIANSIDLNKIIELNKPIIINGLVTKCETFMISQTEKTFSIQLYGDSHTVYEMYTIRYSSLLTDIKITEREKNIVITIYEKFD